MKKLPPMAFLRGFIQSYSNYLKLDTEEIMAVFSKDTKDSAAKDNLSLLDEDEENNNIFKGKSSLSNFPSKIKLILIIAFIVLIGSIFFTKRALIKRPSSKTGQNTQTKNFYKIPEFQQENKRNKGTKVIQKKNHSKKSLNANLSNTKNSNPSLTKKPSSTHPLPSSQLSNNNPNKVPSKRPTSTSSSSPLKNSQKVILEAFNNLKVNYQLDENSPHKLNLLPGQIKVLRAKQKIVLILSDGGAVSIIHNGKRHGVPGSMGTPITLHYPSSPQANPSKP